ncbi:MAG TPA: non-homologous end-joining DNA ligase [Pyrinomonadaceae bacterium]|nr:non-homologous end-joining DNA ligase [Pyrinomonadaceae bacterium]
MPSTVRPMLATLVDQPFSDPDWLFETKWDGVRAICFVRKGRARFVSRNQLEMTGQYPELASIASSLKAKEAILDGEIVALDEHGISRFQLLQPRLGRKNPREIERLAAQSKIAFYVFDLLYLDGFDLTQCKLLDRKSVLERILKTSNNIRYSEHIIGEGERLFHEVAKIPLEGIVAKRIDSPYVQKRSSDWLKVKTIQEMEVVIGGYTEPRKSREYFGALVVGLYQGKELHYVAHVGGGFNHQSLEQLFKLMEPLRTKRCPFIEKPVTNEPVQWVKPKLVVQVKFSEWTSDRRLRHPVFLGLREDKKPEDCVFEPKQKTARAVARAESQSKRSSPRAKR